MDFLLILLGVSGYILFLCVSIFCCRYSSLVLGSKLNITTCLALPLMIICTLQVFLTYLTGFFIKPTFDYWFILSFYIVITSVIESLSAKVVNVKKYTLVKKATPIPNMGFYLNVVIALFIIYACYDSYRVVSNIDLGLLLQDDGQDEFGASAGGGFYARVFLMIMSTYYLGYGKDWKSIGLGLLCFFPSLVVNTKGVIFIPIVAAFIVRYLNGAIKKLKVVLVPLGFIGIFIFFASYMWEYFTLGEDSLTDIYKWQYIGEKLLYYLTAGVQGFSVNLESEKALMYFSKADNVTIAPFSNFLSKFGLMDNVEPLTLWNITIGKLPIFGQCNSNVNTYIGTIYLYNSFLGAIILHVFWVIVTTIIRITAIKYRQPFTVCLFALFATGYVLGWFEFYFMQTFWVYMIVMVVILNVINSLKLKMKRSNASI